MRTGQLGADETDVAHGSMSTHARLANSGRNWFGHPQMTTGAIGAQAEVALLEAVFHLAAVEAHLDAAASSAPNKSHSSVQFGIGAILRGSGSVKHPLNEGEQDCADFIFR